MTERAEREPEHPGCVLGITLGLLLAAAFTGVALVASGRVLDADALLRESFAFEDLPFGLQVVEAAELPGGVRVVRLAHPDHVALEPEPEPEPGESKSDEAESESTPKANDFAFAPRPEMIAGTPPTQAFLVFYAAPKAAVEAFTGGREFGGGDFDRRGGGGGMGGGPGRPGGPAMFGSSPVIVMDNGDLGWGVLRAGFIHERRYEKDTGRDEVRVNLSAPGRYCILFVRWPVDHAGSREQTEEFLAALSPRDG